MRSSALLAIFALLLLLTACNQQKTLAHESYLWTQGGHAARGQRIIREYGCNTCHEIPGVPGARGMVGPPLKGVGDRTFIAGELPNTPDNLMRWLQHPRQVEAHTLMP